MCERLLSRISDGVNIDVVTGDAARDAAVRPEQVVVYLRAVMSQAAARR